MFSGQLGYGYRSFECFIDACIDINNGLAPVESFDHHLATIGTTYRTTAILEAGRRSLDLNGQPITIVYGDNAHPCTPTGFL